MYSILRQDRIIFQLVYICTFSLKVSSKSISFFLFHLSSLYILSFWILLNYFKHLQEKKNILNSVMKRDEKGREMLLRNQKQFRCAFEFDNYQTSVRSISLSHFLLNFFHGGNIKCWVTHFFSNQIWDSGNNILVLHCKQAQRKKWLLPSQSTNDINLIV